MTLSVSTTENLSLPTEFNFWNGDQYTGSCLLLKDKQKLVMHGTGIYKTADDHVYKGIWKNDGLEEVEEIVFADTTTFTGNLDVKMTLQGPGKYTFKENVEIDGEFTDNNLFGKVNLKDPNEKLWKGEAKEGFNEIEFLPLHTFWLSVLSLPSKKIELFYGEATTDENNPSVDLSIL